MPRIALIALWLAALPLAAQEQEPDDARRRRQAELQNRMAELEQRSQTLEAEARQARRQLERARELAELQAEALEHQEWLQERLVDAKAEREEVAAEAREAAEGHENRAAGQAWAKVGQARKALLAGEIRHLQGQLAGISEFLKIDDPARYDEARQLRRQFELRREEWDMVLAPALELEVRVAEMTAHQAEEPSPERAELLKELQAHQAADGPARRQAFELLQGIREREAALETIQRRFWGED